MKGLSCQKHADVRLIVNVHVQQLSTCLGCQRPVAHAPLVSTENLHSVVRIAAWLLVCASWGSAGSTAILIIPTALLCMGSPPRHSRSWGAGHCPSAKCYCKHHGRSTAMQRGNEHNAVPVRNLRVQLPRKLPVHIVYQHQDAWAPA